MDKFEKALKKRDLSKFPNVPYFIKVFQNKLEALQEKLQSCQSEDPRADRYLSKRDFQTTEELIQKLKNDLDFMREH
jgi:DNA repair exonuclease SbcCD ATPase subunit